MDSNDFKIGEEVEVRYSMLNKLRAIRDPECEKWVRKVLTEEDFKTDYIGAMINFEQIRKIL